MGKKLVKTAKQQFEERLRELGNHVAVEINGETFHSGIDKEGHFHILRIGDADVEYSEFDYGCTLLELYQNEEFLDKLAMEFALSREGIKPILEWWTGADKDAEPFDLSDIVKLAPVKKFVEFQDIYEEVPDTLTALEQWEKASEKAKVLWSSEAETVKVEQTETYVKFFRADDVLSCYAYPSLEEMRKDDTFAVRIMDTLVESCQQDRMGDFLRWIKNGGVFPLPIEIIFHSEYQGYTYSDFEDAEEKKNGKQDFKDEMDALRAKMVAHIEQLCEQGLKLNVEVLCMNPFLLWEDACYASTEGIEDCWIAKDDKNRWRFYWKNRDGEYDDALSYFTIDMLRSVIEALQ